MTTANPYPCVHCGYCCTKTMCAYGRAKHGLVPGPCPSLVEIDKNKLCGIFLDGDEELRRNMTLNMGIGAGCSSSLFNTVREAQIKRLREDAQ